MLHELFHSVASQQGDKLAVVGHAGRLSYRQLAAEATRLAGELRRLGAADGDRVAVLMANSAEAAVAIWAVLEAGCVLVPLHAAARADALHPVLCDAEPRWLIAGGELATVFPALLDAHPRIEALLAWNPGPAMTASPDPRQVPWALDPGTAASGTRKAPPEQNRESLAALIYTSGTTGGPKGVMLSHANMLAALRAVNAYLHVEPSDVIYSAMPLSSSYGIYQLILGLAVGATVVLDRSFAFPARSLSLMTAEQVTIFAGVPTMYAWIASTPTLAQYDLSRLRILTSAAAALPLEHARRIRERLPRARLFIMYGQTECKRITYLDPDDLDRKPGSVGRGMPYQEHAVVDEAGLPVPPGEIGELVVRGPHVMQGYWRKPDATAQKLRPIAGSSEPWLHTDDLFRVDDDGYLFFIGRRDDILKIGGHKVSPREVEDVLCQFPGVREAAVIGVEDPVWGQAAKAYVVLQEGATGDTEALTRHCKARMRPFMVPKTVEYVTDLPKTESGKVRKRDLS